MKRCATIIVATLLGGLSASALAASSKPTDRENFSATQPAPAFTLNLAAPLAPPDDEAAQLHTRLDILTRTIQAAHDPLDRAQAHLALANWLLARCTARSATAWLIGVEQTDHLHAIADAVVSARDHLNHAREALESHQDADGDSDANRRRQLEQAADTLEPFAAFFAAASHDRPEARRSAYRKAALALAAIREAEDPELAACALLWQAFGWALAGRHERAIASLPDVLTQPDQPVYDFPARLLRCRLIADNDQPAAAFALTIRMQALCPQWFPELSPAERDARRRLVALLQCRVGRDWLEQLTSTGRSAAAVRLERMLGEVQRNRFLVRDLHDTYHLEPAIPLIVEPLDLGADALGTTSPSTLPAPSPSAPVSQPSPARASQPL